MCQGPVVGSGERLAEGRAKSGGTGLEGAGKSWEQRLQRAWGAAWRMLALSPGVGWEAAGASSGTAVWAPAAYLEHPSQASGLHDSKNSACALPGFGLCCCEVSVTQSHSFLPTRTGSQSWGPVWAPGPWPSLPARPGARGRDPGHLHLCIQGPEASSLPF